MSAVIFKRLFEVRILHGYHLDFRPLRSGAAPGLYHDIADIGDQRELLIRDFNILQDLTITPCKQTLNLLKRLRMKWRALPTGLMAGIEVNPQPGGRFSPKIDIPFDTVFRFFLNVRNPYWYNFTNHAMRSVLPAAYHFTNRREAGDGKIAPSLSLPMPVFSPTRTWEMGEAVLSGTGIQYALESGTNPTFSASMPNHQRAGNTDRKVLAKVFNYRLDPVWGPVQKAEFILEDLSGNEIIHQTSDFSPGQAPAVLRVDFRDVPLSPGSTYNNPVALKDGWYQMQVVLDDNPVGTPTRVLLLDEMINDTTTFGVIEMVHAANMPGGFHLLEPDGTVRTTLNPDAPPTVLNESVFEVRLMSRPTFWLYRLQRGVATTSGDVTNLGTDKMITTTPRLLTKSNQSIAYGAGGIVNLPNPTQLNLKNDAAGAFQSEIFLSLP